MDGEAELLQVVGTLDRRAASRADWTAGSNREINTAMIAMTTRSSIRVKALTDRWSDHMGTTPENVDERKTCKLAKITLSCRRIKRIDLPMQDLFL